MKTPCSKPRVQPFTIGFSVLELLIAVAVIGIVASIVLANAGSAKAKSRNAKRVSDLSELQYALDRYYEDFGYYPICTGANSSSFFVCTSNGYSGGPALSTINLVNSGYRYIPAVPSDPVNTNGQYGYYYGYGYRKLDSTHYTCVNTTGVSGCAKGDPSRSYIFAARLEGSGYSTLCFDAGSDGSCESPYSPSAQHFFGNTNLNYLLGN